MTPILTGMKPTLPPLTADEVLALAASTDLRTAGRAFGIGSDASYAMAREGTFPVPVLRVGRQYRVTRASLIAALGLTESEAA